MLLGVHPFCAQQLTVYSNGAFAFYESYRVGHAEFQGNTQQQVYVIRHRMALVQFNPFFGGTDPGLYPITCPSTRYKWPCDGILR